MMASDRESLTVRVVCEFLRIQQTTVYNLVRQGKIPSFKIGSRWRFRRDVIERWMVEQSLHAQPVRKVIESGVNGKVRHRQMAGSGRT